MSVLFLCVLLFVGFIFRGCSCPTKIKSIEKLVLENFCVGKFPHLQYIKHPGNFSNATKQDCAMYTYVTGELRMCYVDIWALDRPAWLRWVVLCALRTDSVKPTSCNCKKKMCGNGDVDQSRHNLWVIHDTKSCAYQYLPCHMSNWLMCWNWVIEKLAASDACFPS